MLERDDTNGVRVRLPKDRAERVDLLRDGQLELLRVHADVAADPVLAERLDLLELGLRDLRLVREVEAELRGGDERALLVDVVAEDLAEGVVEDVRRGVVVAEGPAPELSCSSQHGEADGDRCGGNGGSARTSSYDETISSPTFSLPYFM